MCFDYSLRGHKEIDVGITLLIIVAGLIGIPIGMLVVLILALIFFITFLMENLLKMAQNLEDRI